MVVLQDGARDGGNVMDESEGGAGKHFNQMEERAGRQQAHLGQMPGAPLLVT